MKKYFFIFLIIILTIALFIFFRTRSINQYPVGVLYPEPPNVTGIADSNEFKHPLQIEYMRKNSYPGNEITIEEDLGKKNNYSEYIASYLSEGLKIYSLLTIPTGEKPAEGWPAVVFNHGYIPPEQYQTNVRYEAYVDGFARNGFVVFKPDYRGFGKSQGQPEGAYYSPAYTVDVLNALSSIKNYPEINGENIGMWGHSLGGNITMRSMVISRDIKAGVIWAGVVGTYEELMTGWRRSTPWQPSPREAQNHVRSIRANLVEKYGEPSADSPFWKSIDPRFHLSDLSGPVQIHHGTADDEVPIEFSQSLSEGLEKAGIGHEYYSYPGGDHNLSGGSFGLAMQRSVEFFKKYLQ